MTTFVGRSDEQNRFREVLREASGKPGDGPDEGYVVLVQGYGGIGKSTLLSRFAAIAGGRLSEPAVGRFTIFEVDWEDDQKLHGEDYIDFAGPPVWRVLERIRAALDNASQGWGRRDRRRLRGFAEFQRQITWLPELEKRAAELGLTKQVGHRPMSPQQVDKAVKAAGQAAEVAGMATTVVNPVGAAVGAAMELGSAALQRRPARLDPALYRALVDQVDALATAFSTGLRALATKQPVVVVLDSCELLGGSGPWLRELTRRCGRRVIWVIGTRLEPELLAAGESEARNYTTELADSRLRTMTLSRFDDRTAKSFLQHRLGDLPAHLDVQRVAELTQGVPLALDFMAKLVHDCMRTGRRFDDLYEEVRSDGSVSSVVREMANRYLAHANKDSGSELHRDLPLLYGLALISIDHDIPARRTSNPYPDMAAPVPVDRDPDLLAALWGIPAGKVAEQLPEISRRHDFIHSGDGTIHRDVRDAVRLFILTPVQRVSDTVQQINQRAVQYLRDRLEVWADRGVEDQVMDASWRTTSVALLWHTFWVDPPEGVRLLQSFIPQAAVLQPTYARILLEVAKFFRPYCSPAHRTVVDGLFQLAGIATPFGEAANASVAMRALDAGEPRTPYVHLLYCQAWSALGLDFIERVRHLRLATKFTKPASGPTADRLGQIAGSLPYVGDLKSRTDADQRAVIDGLRIAARYQRRFSAHNGLGNALYALGRHGEAEAAFRQAVKCGADNAYGHNGLGSALYGLGRYVEAEAAFRKAVRCDPDFAVAHRNLGSTLFGLGRYAEAEAAYREAVRRDAGNAYGHNGLGNALHGLGRYTKAEAAYREAVRRDSANAYGHNGIGNALYGQGRYTEAETAFREAVRCDSNYAYAFNGLGNTLYSLGRYAEAEVAFREAVRCDSHYAYAFNGLGNALYDLGRYAEAEAAFREAVRCDSDYAYAFNGLGNALCGTGCFSEAGSAFRVAVRCDPEYTTPHRMLGLLLLSESRHEEARAEFAAAGNGANVVLLRWAVDRCLQPAHRRTTPQDVLNAIEPAGNLMSSFAIAEIRALALLGRGDVAEAVSAFKGGLAGRRPRNFFERPLYDLAASPEPLAGLDQLLDIWRDIIAEDPLAAGPWGGPD
ncbi:tetratricopeptide repeat protein [Actinoplanes sp. NPDC000266]